MVIAYLRKLIKVIGAITHDILIRKPNWNNYIIKNGSRDQISYNIDISRHDLVFHHVIVNISKVPISVILSYSVDDITYYLCSIGS